MPYWTWSLSIHVTRQTGMTSQDAKMMSVGQVWTKESIMMRATSSIGITPSMMMRVALIMRAASWMMIAAMLWMMIPMMIGTMSWIVIGTTSSMVMDATSSMI